MEKDISLVYQEAVKLRKGHIFVNTVYVLEHVVLSKSYISTHNTKIPLIRDRLAPLSDKKTVFKHLNIACFLGLEGTNLFVDHCTRDISSIGHRCPRFSTFVAKCQRP